MYSRIKNMRENTSTPKRRRLGICGILRPNLQTFDKENLVSDRLNSHLGSPIERPGDVPLPCNQVEYLCDSENNNSVCNDIPCSPGYADCTVLQNADNWKSLVVSKNVNTPIHKSTTICKELEEIEDISDEMFNSRLEEKSKSNYVETSVLPPSVCEKYFRDNIDKSFDVINESIQDLNNDNGKNIQDNNLFDTRDSFLLDIKESGLVLEEKDKSSNVFVKTHPVENKSTSSDSFYGLPMITKDLFKTYRNIEKFYDWQEECLSLEAVKNRQNLIYALPTSGGKTLVAEVLMLREVLVRKHNALFILPYVAIVQEKIWSLSPFALQLDFLVEEYAAGKGHIPPKKRRKKNSIYIATIEKGLALIRSLIELDRLDELGLIVVDELHLVGEEGRGATLEMLLSTVMFANKGIQVVGMSATIGNLPCLARFLRAALYEGDFRPVALAEYVKLGDMLHRIRWTPDGLEVTPERQLAFDYTSLGASADPDRLGGLVAEVVPRASCLVFCPTKRNCENVAALLCQLQRRDMSCHRGPERAALSAALRGEGAGSELTRAVRCGVGYHHAGLSGDERALLENAFRSGVISVLCCTSTLAAGVNLPAERVIVRAPAVGRDFLTLPAYRQMAGRAGRAGLCDAGESIIICSERDWPQLRAVLGGGMPAARSVLGERASSLLLSAVSLRAAVTRRHLRALLQCTLMAQQHTDSPPVDMKRVCDESLRALIRSQAVEVAGAGHARPGDCAPADTSCVVYDDSELTVSQLGRAAIKGCMELSVAKQLLKDLEVASRALVLMGSLHLLYLVTPHDAAGVRPDLRHYYSLYCSLDEEGVQTARVLGITEVNAVRMVTGKPITNVCDRVLRRFYLALMLHDLWNQRPFPDVAHKYNVARGTVQSVLTSSASFAACAARVCEELQLWTFRALLVELAPRLQHCAAPHLAELMDLPAVKKSRALHLSRAGYKRVEDVARAAPDQLTSSVPHLSRTAAAHLISAARMLLIEKVENLRAEAEDVMEQLNV